MIGFLASRFIKDYQNRSDAAVRRAYGVLCGAVGIAINLLLFALKLFAGTLAGSVAVTADAFNNLSDAGASIVTLLGFRLAGQKPDPEHPFGHGRLEYISGLIVSIVILLMGFELLRDAVGAILHPEAVECSVLTVAILLVSICAKFYMYCYNRGVGKKISAAAMQATAADSLSDCAATAAVLLATLAGYFLHWQIDGWCGLVVSLLILWAGVQAARDTLSPLLGQPPTEEFVQEIRDIVMESQVVCGIHDLVVHDYGPGRVMISLHAEVPAHGDILALHDEIDNVEKKLHDRARLRGGHPHGPHRDGRRDHQRRASEDRLARARHRREYLHPRLSHGHGADAHECDLRRRCSLRLQNERQGSGGEDQAGGTRA